LTVNENVSDAVLLDLARHMQLMRTKIVPLFPRDVLRDSVLDMLLELFVAQLKSRNVCIKELIIVSGETSTSALRRIDRLEASDMLKRCPDPADHRRVGVALTEKGEEAMRAMLHHLFLDNGSVANRDSATRLWPAAPIAPSPTPS